MSRRAAVNSQMSRFVEHAAKLPLRLIDHF
jgi:hypothetical protein